MDNLISALVFTIFTSPLFNHGEVIDNKAGIDALKKGDNATALKLFSKAQSRDPYNPALRYNMGSALYHNGQTDKAVQEFQAAVSNARSNRADLLPKALYNSGNAFFESARMKEKEDPSQAANLYDQSIQAYAEALQHDPEDGDARHNLQLALERKRAIKPPPQDQKSKTGKNNKQEQKKNTAPNKDSKPKPEKEDSQNSEKQSGQEMKREEVERILQSIQEQELEEKQKERATVQDQDNDEW